MSTEMPIGLTLTEKIVGLVLLILGAFFAYISLTPPSGDISYFGGIFVLIGVAIAAAGILLLISRNN